MDSDTVVTANWLENLIKSFRKHGEGLYQPKLLEKNNISVTQISDYTGSKEMMEGRVKSLHPKIFAGILALRNNKKHMKEIKENKIDLIDIIVVNLVLQSGRTPIFYLAKEMQIGNGGQI